MKYLLYLTPVLVAVLSYWFFVDKNPTIFECAFIGDIKCLQLLSKPDEISEEKSKYLATLGMVSSPSTKYQCSLVSKPEHQDTDPLQFSFSKESVHFLLSTRDERGNSILHWAAKANHLHLVSCFSELSSAASIARDELFPRNSLGSSPLHWSVTSDDSLAITNKLLNVHYSPSTYGGSLKFYDENTLSHSKNDTLSRTIPISVASSKAIVNLANELGESPLHWAVEWKAWRTVRTLLLAGADPTHVDSQLNTPLHKVSPDCHDHADCQNIFALLVKFGAVVTAENQYKRTPFQHFDFKVAPPPTDKTLGFASTGSFALSEEEREYLTTLGIESLSKLAENIRELASAESIEVGTQEDDATTLDLMAHNRHASRQNRLKNLEQLLD